MNQYKLFDDQMISDISQDKVKKGDTSLKTIASDFSYRRGQEEKRKQESKVSHVLQQSLGLSILKKDFQDVPRRWDNDYILNLLRGKVPELHGGKKREMVR